MESKSKEMAEQGKRKMEWAGQSMGVLRAIQERFLEEKPLEGVRISACLHVTAETGVLMQTMQKGGADICLCASNPLSTQDDVAASLAVHDGMKVFAIHGVDRDGYYKHIRKALAHRPHITMDDGADLVQLLHTEYREQLDEIKGGTEETTTGVIRLRSMARESVLGYPVIAVNDAKTKYLFDNRYGTGQSTMDGIMRATNRLMSGAVFVVCGYGWCGRGVAMRAAGMGARVVVVEVDPFRALEAVMDGYQVMPMMEAAGVGDFFCTVTGNQHVIRGEHFACMKDGAIVSNAGHFNVEINLGELEEMATARRMMRESLEEFVLEDGRKLYLLGQGRLVNLAAAEGHPANVMDMSFANQALSVEHLLHHAQTMESKVYAVPDAIDAHVAAMKLQTMGVVYDTLSTQQQVYLNAWIMGT